MMRTGAGWTNGIAAGLALALAAAAAAQPGAAPVRPEADVAAQLAAARYPSPVLLGLWQRLRTDPRALEDFRAERQGQGPLIEPVAGDPGARRVTYLYFGDAETEAVRASAGPHAATGGILMTRFLQTPLFYASELVPADARYTYGFALIETRRSGPGGEVVTSEDRFDGDPLNPHLFGGRPLIELPNAPVAAEAAERPLPARGTVTRAAIASRALGETRPISVYTPPGLAAAGAADLLIVLDGRLYASAVAEDGVPVPTILDNLLADRRIGPVVAIFVDNLPGRRDRDLAANPAFADFLANELVAWARAHHRIAAGPAHVVVAGSSLGGAAAADCAFRHPERVGNVLSQSGAFWLTDRGATWRSPYPTGGDGLVIARYRDTPRRPVRFALSVGRFEDATNLFATNRDFRDVLLAKGYAVAYEEVDGGHEAASWRTTFARGLTALIGRPSRARGSAPQGRTD